MISLKAGFLALVYVLSPPALYKSTPPPQGAYSLKYDVDSFIGKVADVNWRVWVKDGDGGKYSISHLELRLSGLARIAGDKNAVSSKCEYDDSDDGMKIISYTFKKNDGDEFLKYTNRAKGVDATCIYGDDYKTCDPTPEHLDHPDGLVALFSVMFDSHLEQTVQAGIFYKGRNGIVRVHPGEKETITVRGERVDTRIYTVSDLGALIEKKFLVDEDKLAIKAWVREEAPHYPERIEIQGLFVDVVLERRVE